MMYRYELHNSKGRKVAHSSDVGFLISEARELNRHGTSGAYIVDTLAPGWRIEIKKEVKVG